MSKKNLLGLRMLSLDAKEIDLALNKGNIIFKHGKVSEFYPKLLSDEDYHVYCDICRCTIMKYGEEDVKKCKHSDEHEADICIECSQRFKDKYDSQEETNKTLPAIGAIVQVNNLEKQKKYNGLEGVVIEHKIREGEIPRACVKLLKLDKIIAVKSNNLGPAHIYVHMTDDGLLNINLPKEIPFHIDGREVMKRGIVNPLDLNWLEDDKTKHVFTINNGVENVITNNADKACIICFRDNNELVSILPMLYHTNDHMCVDCASEIQEKNMLCPICRKDHQLIKYEENDFLNLGLKTLTFL